MQLCTVENVASSKECVVCGTVRGEPSALRSACGVPDDANGRTAFDRTLQAVVGSNVPHKNKSLIQALADNWKLRPPPKTAAPMQS